MAVDYMHIMGEDVDPESGIMGQKTKVLKHLKDDVVPRLSVYGSAKMLNMEPSKFHLIELAGLDMLRKYELLCRKNMTQSPAP